MKSNVGTWMFLDATQINHHARIQLFWKYHSTEQIQKLHYISRLTKYLFGLTKDLNPKTWQTCLKLWFQSWWNEILMKSVRPSIPLYLFLRLNGLYSSPSNKSPWHFREKLIIFLCFEVERNIQIFILFLSNISCIRWLKMNQWKWSAAVVWVFRRWLI